MKFIAVLACAATILWIQGASAATVMITGSNRGLGFEFAKEYADAGWTVIATARTPAKDEALRDLAAAHKNVVVETLDVTDGASINALAAKYKGKPIDLLINNAGVIGDPAKESLGSFDYELFQQMMHTNAFGALAVSDAFKENVAASAQKKIVAITSSAGSLSDGHLGSNLRFYFYGTSKTALVRLMFLFKGDVAKQGIVVGLIAPGGVDTDMLRYANGEEAAHGMKPPQSIGSMIKVIAGLTQENSKTPLNYDGKPLPW